MPDTSTRVVAVIGPTATGKSDLAVALAQRLDGEVVNADSMQLYQGMDVGTAKLAEAERGGVRHHLLDVWPLEKSAAVAQYQSMAREVIDEIAGRGKLPVVVGGSGLYLRGALDALDFPGESPALRAGLYAALDEHGPEALHARLAERDPVAAAAILPSNGRRIVRALEVIELTGQPFVARMPGFESVYDTVQLGLDRADLGERVDLRVHRMMAAGLLDEIRGLLPLLGVEGIATAAWSEGGRRGRGRGRTGERPAARTGDKPARSPEKMRERQPEARAEALPPSSRSERGERAERRPQTERRPDRASERGAERAPDRVPDRMAEPRREPRHRPDDLGPAVTGFGGEIPAFMLLPTRVRRPEPAYSEQDDPDIALDAD